MKGWQDKQIDGLMEETVNEAIFITVPLNQTAADGPAEHSEAFHSQPHMQEGDIYIRVNFSLMIK